MNTLTLTTTSRRTALIELARSIAARARWTATLQQIRDVGAQLDALDPSSPEATDVLNAARLILQRKLEALDRLGA